MFKLLSLITIVGLFIIDSQSVTAQDETSTGKMYYIELGGPGVVTSINYDSRFKANTRFGFGYRIGIGVIPPFSKISEMTGNDDINIGNSSDAINVIEIAIDMFQFNMDLTKAFFLTVTNGNYTFPIGVNYVFGNPNKTSLFEIGAGITYLSKKRSLFVWEVKEPGNIIGHLSFMYRLTPLNKGISVRGGFTPMIGTAGDLFPMGSISVGYAF